VLWELHRELASLEALFQELTASGSDGNGTTGGDGDSGSDDEEVA
jgi:hypothetical protein